MSIRIVTCKLSIRVAVFMRAFVYVISVHSLVSALEISDVPDIRFWPKR